jgi:hypothetical protein
MNHTPANVSSTKRFHFHRHARTYYPTMIREQPIVSYQTQQLHHGIRSLYFGNLPIAFLDEGCAGGRLTDNTLKVVTYIRSYHAINHTVTHCHVANFRTTKFLILTERGTCAKTKRHRGGGKESPCPDPQNGGLEPLHLLSTRCLFLNVPLFYEATALCVLVANPPGAVQFGCGFPRLAL